MNLLRVFCLCVAVAASLSGCSTADVSDKSKYATVRIFLQRPPQLPPEQRTELVIPNPPMTVTVGRFAELSEHDMIQAEAVKTGSSKLLVLEFDAHGRMLIENFTTERRGECYVLVINNVPVAAPAIRQTIRDGKLVVEMDMTDEELDSVAKRINAAIKRYRQNALLK
ncbi:MAG: hypothetical protein N2689_07835 [Verrucomicrobiae bacterium]|nr:hypothetical protein [Verrucomicrobiae bacterium]